MKRKFVGNVVLAISAICANYFGTWKMLLLPIIECANAYGDHTLTVSFAIISIIKILFSEVVTAMFYLLGIVVRSIIINWNENGKGF